MHPRLLPLVLAILLAPMPASAQDAPATPPAATPSNPVLLEAAAPTYPRSRFKNPNRSVLVGLTVNTGGVPENVHVVRSGGDRFDKNAVDTVRQYKFKPALDAGQPVPRDIQIEVNYTAK